MKWLGIAIFSIPLIIALMEFNTVNARNVFFIYGLALLGFVLFFGGLRQEIVQEVREDTKREIDKAFAAERKRRKDESERSD